MNHQETMHSSIHERKKKHTTQTRQKKRRKVIKPNYDNKHVLKTLTAKCSSVIRCRKQERKEGMLLARLFVPLNPNLV